MSTAVLRDLAQLPRVEDGWTFLYTEHVRIQRADSAIEIVDKSGRVPVPGAVLSCLLLGPGATITHAAVVALAEVGCSIIWCGEGLARFYAFGLGDTRRAQNLEAQAKAWASETLHAAVVRRMYLQRFDEELPDDLSLEQIRGREGVRVREAYAKASRDTGVPWSGRSYRRGDWSAADPINRALSAANACLYGVCHAAIVATGFSAGLGFIHVGKQLSFIYDIADLYKVDVSVPAAFQGAQGGFNGIESRVRKLCRERFVDSRILERIVPDIQAIIGVTSEKTRFLAHRGTMEDPELTPPDEEPAEPGALWNSDGSRVAGGRNFALAKTQPPAGPGLASAARKVESMDDDRAHVLAVNDDDEEPPF
jgi:CRISPR-associated protein Cas1